MAKVEYSKSSQSNSSSQKQVSYGNYKDRNLAAADPLKMQEEVKPTEAEPVRMHARMAGCS